MKNDWSNMNLPIVGKHTIKTKDLIRTKESLYKRLKFWVISLFRKRRQFQLVYDQRVVNQKQRNEL